MESKAILVLAGPGGRETAKWLRLPPGDKRKMSVVIDDFEDHLNLHWRRYRTTSPPVVTTDDDGVLLLRVSTVGQGDDFEAILDAVLKQATDWGLTHDNLTH